MSAILDQHLHDYLTIRRSVGFNLDRTEKLLGQFLDHLADHDLTRITTDAAIAGEHTRGGRHELVGAAVVGRPLFRPSSPRHRPVP